MTSPEDLEDLDILRKKSYYTSGVVDPAKFGSLVDEYDHHPNCHVLGLYLQEKLAGSVRLHVVDASELHGPTSHYFPQRAIEYTRGSMRYVDPSRLAIDPDLSWRYPMLPLLILRTAAMAAEYFNIDHCMSIVREDLARSYTRFFGASLLEAPRHFPALTDPHMLMIASMSVVRNHIATHLPFFGSTETERKMMFAPVADLEFAPLTIWPSAKQAIRAFELQPSVQ